MAVALSVSATCLGAHARVLRASRLVRGRGVPALRAVERTPGERAEDASSSKGASAAKRDALGANNAVSRGADGTPASAARPTDRPRPGSEPSLADYDEAVYGGADAIHSDALVPRLERSINALIVASAVFRDTPLYSAQSHAPAGLYSSQSDVTPSFGVAPLPHSPSCTLYVFSYQLFASVGDLRGLRSLFFQNDLLSPYPPPKKVAYALAAPFSKCEPTSSFRRGEPVTVTGSDMVTKK